MTTRIYATPEIELVAFAGPGGAPRIQVTLSQEYRTLTYAEVKAMNDALTGWIRKYERDALNAPRELKL